ncbi:hypothetical protein DRP77_13255 [Candidatus Poribacteria bacterium]|nr:MAG: hypothetical protein DRP77_13255 [Candidatus Poribacteria bacterium]
MGGEVEDELSGIDPGSFEYSLNGGPWVRFENDADRPGVWADVDEIPPLIGDGRFRLRVRVKDRAGNAGVSEEVPISADARPPVAFISSPTHPEQNAWYSKRRVEFTISGWDGGSGLAGYSFALDRSPDTVPEEAITLRPETRKLEFELADGTWFLHLRPVDEAGNWGETVSFRVNIDSTPPRARIELLTPKLDISKGELRLERPADRPVLRPGPAEVILTLTEKLTEGPRLFIRFGNAAERVTLEGEGLRFRGRIYIDLEAPEGEREFVVEGSDRAGNSVSIAGVRRFLVRTSVGPDEEALIASWDLKAALLIPKGAVEGEVEAELRREGSWYRAATHPEIVFKRPAKAILLRADPLRRPFLIFNDGVRSFRLDAEVRNGMLIAEIERPGRFSIGYLKPKKLEVRAAPNPFTTATTFYISGGAKEAVIRIFRPDGKLIKTLKGMRSWDGTDEEGRRVESGIYIYQVESEGRIASGTVVFIR